MRRLLIIGNPEVFHVGHHFENAAKEMGLLTKLCDITEAYQGLFLIRKWDWWIRGRWPSRTKYFEKKIIEVCAEFNPERLLATGSAPLGRDCLVGLAKTGVRLINYLTDDPWNSNHRAPWFLQALPFYHHVFTPRRANLNDLRGIGCNHVSFLPFAYSPELHYQVTEVSDEDRRQLDCDILFVGGADPDRISFLAALINVGLKVRLYGSYWDKFPSMRRYHYGMADPTTLRAATACAKVTLCLVRRANRDGNCMRTFEAPAMGACMLTEDTDEHREIFGCEGQSVSYFKNKDEMIKKAKFLINHPEERSRLAVAARQVMIRGCHTYKDRLNTMLSPLS